MAPKLTVNYGLRLDVINPQTVNEAGNGTWVDLSDRPRPGRRCRWRRSRWQYRECVQLGAAPRRHLPVEREDRHPRRLWTQLRHRRVRDAVRTHGHAEPARARRSESQPGEQLRLGVHPGLGPAEPELGDGRFRRDVPVAERRDAARVATQAAPAGSGCVERDGPAAVERHDVARGGLRRQSWRPRVCGEQPGRERQSTGDRRLPERAAEHAPAVLCGRCSAQRPRHRRQLRLDAERGRLLQRGREPIPLAANEVHEALLRRMVRSAQLHAAEGRTE